MSKTSIGCPRSVLVGSSSKNTRQNLRYWILRVQIRASSLGFRVYGLELNCLGIGFVVSGLHPLESWSLLHLPEIKRSGMAKSSESCYMSTNPPHELKFAVNPKP